MAVYPNPRRAGALRWICITAGLAVALSAGLSPRTSLAQEPDVRLTPHRAVYDLKLVEARGKQSLQAVRGRIVYDFSGNACEGYALQFRQVTELDTGEGRQAMSDLRSTTWEDGAAKAFQFASQNFLNQQETSSTKGRAERDGSGVAVALTKPETKATTLDVPVVFPTEHVRKVIAAARAGKSLLEVSVYDGSDNGEKIYNTLAVIGKPIGPDKPSQDAVASHAEVASLKRWPVTISYFDRSKRGGEQTPVYSIGFELYENGISRELSLDYGDFVIAGTMTSLEIHDSKNCP